MSPSKQIWGTNGPDMQTEEGRYILHLDGCVQRRRLTSLPVNLAHQLSPATTTPAEPTMAAKAFRGGGSGTTASRSVRPSIRRWGSRRDARNLALAPNLPPPHPPANRSRRRGMAINRWMTHGCCCCCGSTNQLRSHTNTAIICQVMKMY